MSNELTSQHRSFLENEKLAGHIVDVIKLRVAENRKWEQSRKREGVKYTPREFESDISRILETLFPLCVISNIRYFSPSILERENYGNEIDNVFHVSNANHEYILIVEAKKQAIDVRRADRWMATYPNGVSNVVEKANAQMRTLLEFLGSSDMNSKLKSGVMLRGSAPPQFS